MSYKSFKLFVPFSLAILFVILTFITPDVAEATLPSSTNYQLQNYSFGAGGATNATSSNFGLNGIAGEVEFGQPGSASFQVGSGLTYLMKANVPSAPTLSTPANNYDRILFIINTSGNPTDATYALEISTTSNFSSNVNYIKQDGTVGSTLTSADYKTYTNWGGASGTFVTGLLSNTTYYIRARARQGNFTESDWGPAASTTTLFASLTFTINNPTINFANLNASNSYTDSSKSDTLTTTTNAFNGYTIYARVNQPLTTPDGNTITNYISPNSTPTSWSGTGFGYTTNDTNLSGTGGANRFSNGTLYAGFGTAAPGDPVADDPGPAIGSQINDSFTVSYRVTATNTTPAGTYTNEIIYTIVPSY